MQGMFSETVRAIAGRLDRAGDLLEFESQIREHRARYIVKLKTVGDLSGPNRQIILFCQNSIRHLQHLLFRSQSLMKGSFAAINANLLLPCLMCVRAHYETTGSAAYLLKRIKGYCEGTLDLASLDNYLLRLSMGAKSIENPEVPEPINVMDMIDSVDHYLKKYLFPADPEDKKFRSSFDVLSDFCHPNFHGTCCGSEIIVSERAFQFNRTDELRDDDVAFFFYLNMSTTLFLTFYKDCYRLLHDRILLPDTIIVEEP